MKRMIALLVPAVLLAGCGLNDPFAAQQKIDRAALAESPLTPASVAAGASSVPDSTSSVPISPVESVVKGTYVFAVPGTVTQLHHTTNTFDQYALYMGQPGPADTPFIVITVAGDVGTYADKPTGNYAIEKTRNYILNGLMVSEATGFTKDKHQPFSEMVVRRPGGGDKLHAITVVKDNEARDVALEILGTIKWEATK